MNGGVLAVLGGLSGAVVARIRRVFFVHRGVMGTDVGALELKFADGRCLLVDVGPDGESLRAELREWTDPFVVGGMTPDDFLFVERSGKWTAFDVSRQPGYASILEGVVTSVSPMTSASGEVVGAIIETSKGGIRAEVQADELLVRVG